MKGGALCVRLKASGFTVLGLGFRVFDLGLRCELQGSGFVVLIPESHVA